MSIVTAAPSLDRYRTVHRIEPTPHAEGWQVCKTDGIRVYTVMGRRWKHDLHVIRQLIEAEGRAIPQPDQVAAYVSPYNDDGTYVSEIADDPLGQAKAREDAFENGTLTFEWQGHAVDVDLT